jgi:hypothetical protein
MISKWRFREDFAVQDKNFVFFLVRKKSIYIFAPALRQKVGRIINFGVPKQRKKKFVEEIDKVQFSGLT